MSCGNSLAVLSSWISPHGVAFNPLLKLFRTGGYMKNLRGVVLGVLFLLIGSFPLHAQQFSAVSGVVSDKSGGVVSGVTVELDNGQLGLHESTTTNDLGFYQFLRQAPGQGYTLTFTKDGFT